MLFRLGRKRQDHLRFCSGRTHRLDHHKGYGYGRLTDLRQAAEDYTGEYLKTFNAYLFAVITQSLMENGAGKALETAVHRGQWDQFATVREDLRSAPM